MARVLSILGYVYAALAGVTGGLCGAAAWTIVKLDSRGDVRDICSSLPPGGHLGEIPATLELSWFPFGYQCVYPRAGGGTIIVPPTDWTATAALVIAWVLVASAAVVLVGIRLTRRRSRRRIIDAPD